MWRQLFRWDFAFVFIMLCIPGPRAQESANLNHSGNLFIAYVLKFFSSLRIPVNRKLLLPSQGERWDLRVVLLVCICEFNLHHWKLPLSASSKPRTHIHSCTDSELCGVTGYLWWTSEFAFLWQGQAEPASFLGKARRRHVLPGAWVNLSSHFQRKMGAVTWLLMCKAPGQWMGGEVLRLSWYCRFDLGIPAHHFSIWGSLVLWSGSHHFSKSDLLLVRKGSWFSKKFYLPSFAKSAVSLRLCHIKNHGWQIWFPTPMSLSDLCVIHAS